MELNWGVAESISKGGGAIRALFYKSFIEDIWEVFQMDVFWFRVCLHQKRPLKCPLEYPWQGQFLAVHSKKAHKTHFKTIIINQFTINHKRLEVRYKVRYKSTVCYKVWKRP